jgi:hypothetical protein
VSSHIRIQTCICIVDFGVDDFQAQCYVALLQKCRQVCLPFKIPSFEGVSHVNRHSMQLPGRTESFF